MTFRSLLKSTLLLGSTSLANTGLGIVRVKLLALMIGPAGLGILGTLAAISGVGTVLAALGADTSGTREIALKAGKRHEVARVRTVLTVIGLVHGLIALGAVFVFRQDIALWVFGDAAHAEDVGWLGLGVLFSLLAGLQITQLQGLGRVGDVARVSLLSAIVGTIAGLGAVWHWGIKGLIVLVLAQPAASMVLACWRTSDLPWQTPRRDEAVAFFARWRGIIGQGSPYMASFLMLALTPLAIRSLIIQHLGLEAAGYFHASWTISVIYVGFLLSAMSADYFPRLTGLVADKAQANSLINEQAQLGLSIGGPILLVILALAAWIIPLLYTSDFLPAVDVLEWQSIGNLMKIAGWPVAYLSMARGRSVQFFLIELAWSGVFFGLVWWGLPLFGLEAVGAAFAVACIFFFVLQSAVAFATFGFKWEHQSLLMLLSLLLAAAATLFAARYSIYLQAFVGLSCAGVLGLTGLRFILLKAGSNGRYSSVVSDLFRRAGWPLPGKKSGAPATT